MIKLIILLVLTAVVAAQDGGYQACTRKSNGRGAGFVMKPQCGADEEVNGALCYPKCKPGYEPVGCCLCRYATCPSRFPPTADGASCQKPKPYDRPGYPWKFGDPLNDSRMYARCQGDHGNGNCEKWGAIVYPKCKPGFYAVGCCICSPNCPAGTKDMGALCIKETYGRGAGVSRLGCSGDLEKSGLLCYPKCEKGMNGVGPVCWGTCNQKYTFNCGVFCTVNQKECAKLVASTIKDGIELGKAVVEGGMGIATGQVADGAATLKEAFDIGKDIKEKFSNVKFCEAD